MIQSKRGDIAQGDNGVPGWIMMLLLAAVIFGSLFVAFGNKIINWLKILIP